MTEKNPNQHLTKSTPETQSAPATQSVSDNPLDTPSPLNTRVEAATFRRLLAHLDANKQAQNIDLMIVADFCRNCLAKWYSEEAAKEGLSLDYDAAREIIYGMPYAQWKQHHQLPASPEKLAALENKKKHS